MKLHEISRPIGLNAPCNEIESVCRSAPMYKRCGLRPNHLIIPLDSGSGRTSIVEYMTDKYKNAGVLDFSSGLDDYIEISFDGTLQQLKHAFAAIDAAAVYTNEYGSIIGMDISCIASHLGETQLTEFIKNCKRVCSHACVIFFVHSTPSRNEEKLLEKLCEEVDNIKRLAVEPYTQDDIAALIKKGILEHGIEIRNETAFNSALSDLISAFSISTVKDATVVADTLVRFSDFSDFTPFVDESSLKAMVKSWHDIVKRRDAQ